MCVYFEFAKRLYLLSLSKIIVLRKQTLDCLTPKPNFFPYDKEQHENENVGRSYK